MLLPGLLRRILVLTLGGVEKANEVNAVEKLVSNRRGVQYASFTVRARLRGREEHRKEEFRMVEMFHRIHTELKIVPYDSDLSMEEYIMPLQVESKFRSDHRQNRTNSSLPVIGESNLLCCLIDIMRMGIKTSLKVRTLKTPRRFS